jgi:hypothetical protein
LLSETTSDVPNLVDRTTRKDEFGLTKKSVWFVFFASMLVLGGFVWILSRIGRDTPAVGLDPRLGIYQASSAAVDGGWSDAVTFDIRFDAASNSYRAYADAPRASSRSSPQKWFASGRYTQNFRDNGWNYLEIENAPVSSDEDYIKGMKAVGVMEGFLTCNHTKMFYLNYMHGMFEGRLPMDSTINFLRKNYNWVRAKADTLYASDDYWLSVKGTLAQLEGMVEGHRLSCPCEEAEAVDVDSSAGATSGRGMGSKCDGSFWTMNNPTIMHFLLLNANGDLFQINQKFTQSSDDGRRKQMQSEKDLEGADQISDQEPMASLDASNSSITASHRQLRLPRKRTNHCSAIFKLLADKSDVVFGHNTWDTYESASPRAIKRFKLHTFERSDVILRRWDPASPIYGDFEAFWDPYPTATTRATETTRWGKASSAAADRDGNSSPKARLQEILFSSSAGFLSSVDDFYVTKGGHGDLAIIETSLDVYRDPIISQIVPESMLYWMRVRTATVLASSGSEWALWFSLFHSGTYVNQWLVLDMALFHPGEPDLRKGLFTVLEEMPGKAHIEDKSAHLSVRLLALFLYSEISDIGLYLQTYGYWASYNLPYFPEILRYSGASDLCDANPSLNCYSTDPRARIFRARQGNVTSISALQDLMLYNDFERDPLSLNDPCNVSQL